MSYEGLFPLPIHAGGSNATNFPELNGIMVYDGADLINFLGTDIDPSGEYSNTNQSVVTGVRITNAINQTGSGGTATIKFPTPIVDVNIGYNPLTGLISPVEPGNYLITYNITALTTSTWTSGLSTFSGLIINGVNTFRNFGSQPTTKEFTAQVSIIVPLHISDTLGVTLTATTVAGTLNTTIQGLASRLTSFSAELLS